MVLDQVAQDQGRAAPSAGLAVHIRAFASACMLCMQQLIHQHPCEAGQPGADEKEMNTGSFKRQTKQLNYWILRLWKEWHYSNLQQENNVMDSKS